MSTTTPSLPADNANFPGRPHQAVPLPPRLAARPKDHRGYPIPWNVQLDAAGRPDFRVIDQRKVAQAVRNRVCGLCGEPLGRHLAFIGGPLSHQSRFFTDPPMHKDCAQYALRVCPWLAAPNMRYAEQLPQLAGVTTVVHTQMISDQRPERFFVATTRDYRLVRMPDGAVVLQAEPWEWSEWWRHGQQGADAT